MTTKTQTYIHQSLAACGFAVLSSVVAWKLRPDLWGSAQECGISFAPRPVEGVEKVTAHLVGIGPVPMLTRSLDMLAQRVEWVTGCQVEAIDDGGASPVATVRPLSAMPALAKTHDLRAGKDYGVATKEGPRTCGECHNLTAGGTCKAAARCVLDFVAGEYRPLPNALRKCLGFTAKFEAMDGRNGRALWPEIAAVVDAANSPETPATDEGAAGFLAVKLAAGPVPAADLIDGAAALGIAERTLQEAAQRMGVMKAKAGMAGGWVWSLPEKAAA
jgi:hypothetical protein